MNYFTGNNHPITVAIRFICGFIERQPLDELQFIDRHDQWAICKEWEFSEWKDLPIKAVKSTGGAIATVELTTDYSGYYVGTVYGTHPIEHIKDSRYLWDMPLYGIDDKLVSLTSEFKRRFGIPEVDRPPFPTTFFGTDSSSLLRDPPRIPIAEIKDIESDSLMLFYEHPLKGETAWYPRSYQLAIEIATATPRRQSHFISIEEMLASSLEPEWVVDGVIQKGNLICLVGPSGEGKSFIVIDIGLSVAAGTSWNGNKCQQGTVAYCAGEGLKGVDLRVRAYLNKLDYDDIIPFYRTRHTISLSGGGLIELIEDLREIEASTGILISLIIIDTLHRHYDGCENDAQDMAKFIAALDNLRDHFPGSSVMVVHHSGWVGAKESRGRGSSSWKAALDLEMFCNQGQLLCTKSKDQEPFAPIMFKLMPVMLGTDSKGKDIVTCTVQYGERSIGHKNQKLSGINLIALESLLWAASNKAVEDNDGMVGALIGDWREAFDKERLESKPDLSQDSLRRSFERAVEALKELSLIRSEGYSHIPLSPAHQQTIQSRMQ